MRRAAAFAFTLVLTACASSGSDSASPTTSSIATVAASTTTVTQSTLAPTTTVATTTTSTTTTAQPAARLTIAELLDTDGYVRIAHAGGDLEGPHSTMFAFEQSWAAGAQVLELDVQLTADDVLVVQHDLTVDKTTEVTGPVDELTLEQLQALDNAYWFSPDCWPCQDLPVESYIYRGVRTGDAEPPDGHDADDFRVITFRELVEAFPEAAFDVEIKGSTESEESTEAILRAAGVLAAEVIELDIVDSTVVVSFIDDAVTEYQRLVPDGWTSPGQDALLAWVLAGGSIDQHRIIQVPPFFEGVPVVTPELIETVHDQGLDIWVWPNDADAQENAEYYAELIAIGVDGIIAGRPSALPPG